MKGQTIEVKTGRKRQVVDITDEAAALLAESGVKEGLCTLFVQHTTAALAVGEAAEGTDEDLLETLDKLIPRIAFRHGHDPSHAPDHMIASIIGPDLILPVAGGKLALGTWQRVLLVELNGPRSRTVALRFAG